MLKQPLQSGEYEKSLPDVLVDIELRGGNPFPGLRPFSLDECHLFFGREGQADEILELPHITGPGMAPKNPE